MEYHEAVNTLERLRRLRPKLGTETTASLLEHLGDPHRDIATVQIAGSNGKGSTARILEGILREAGLDVGLYTSPDLNDIRDRVRVRDQKIPKHEVVRFVEDAWPYIVERSVEGDAPTFFEAFTGLALWHFGREDVDVAILEVGIGGRYDATSVVDPVAAAVTSVSLEHTDIIGSTVEEIASDKAHVAPDGVPLVTGARGAALETIRGKTDVLTVGNGVEAQRARSSGDGSDAGASGEGSDAGASEEGSDDSVSGGNSGDTAAECGDAGDFDVHAVEGEMVSLSESTISLDGPDWAVETRTPLLGGHQAVNAGIAAALARQTADVTEEDIERGIRNVHWPGRFEVMDDEPLAVLDGAHNPDACAKLAAILDRFDYDDLSIVFGAMRDKDHHEMIRMLPASDEVLVVEPAVDRSQDLDTLETIFSRETDATVSRSGSVLDAVDRALRSADDTDCVLVTGSLYTVSEARDHWTRAPRTVRTETAGRASEVMRNADVPPRKRRERAEDMVQRTVRFHVRREQAVELQETMLSLGATCTVSGIATAEEHVEVVLAGTLEQYRDLVRDLRGKPGGFKHLASQLNQALPFGTERTRSRYPWNDGTAVMGILNVTPDSFHDGGTNETVEDAVARAEEMVNAGAHVVDVGGESTRPGADPISTEEERQRVLPVVERLGGLDALVSVDTRKPSIAAAALDAGADMVNDVTGLADASMRRVVADREVPVVMMHSLSAPVDPDRSYVYDDVVDDVLEALSERLLLAERAGIDRSNVVVDPGLGFGKRAAESFELLDRLDEFRALGTSVMVGHSQKSMFEPVENGSAERLAPTVAATALAAERGVDIVRVHDVAPNAAAIATAERTTQRWS